MTAPTRRRGRPGYDQEALLARAVEVFNDRGFDATSMDDLAQGLGITKSAIYHHVASKDALLALALNQALDGLAEVAATVANGDDPAIDRLERLLRGSVAVLVQRLPYVRLLLRVRGNTAVERAALARRRQFDRLVAQLVTEGMAAGDVRPDVDAAVTSRLLFGMVNSIAEWHRAPQPRDIDLLADALCAMAFSGLRRRPGIC